MGHGFLRSSAAFSGVLVLLIFTSSCQKARQSSQANLNPENSDQFDYSGSMDDFGISFNNSKSSSSGAPVTNPFSQGDLPTDAESLDPSMITALMDLFAGLSSGDQMRAKDQLLNRMNSCEFLVTTSNLGLSRRECTNGNASACAHQVMALPTFLLQSYVQNLTEGGFDGSREDFQKAMAEAKEFCQSANLEDPNEFKHKYDEKKQQCRAGSFMSCLSLILMMIKYFLKSLIGIVLGFASGM